MGYWARYYRGLDRMLGFIPQINPDLISLVSVPLSLVFFFTRADMALSLGVLFLVLVLDFLDGSMARRLNKNDVIIDLGCDRASELIIFFNSPQGILFASVNILLTIIRLNYKIPIILPLRQSLFLYLLLAYSAVI